MKFYCEVCEKDVEIDEKFKCSIIEDFGNKQREIQMFCPNNNDHWKIIKEREFKAITLQQKKEFIDNLGKGMKLGDCCKLVGVSLDIGCEILNRQIKSLDFIDWDVVNE
jgi:hypothetical protein